MRSCFLLASSILAVGGLSPAAPAAQQPGGVPPTRSHVLRGSVTAGGAPVRGADVFLLESLDAATTDSAGHFSIRTAAAGSVTIVVRRIGYAPANVIVPVESRTEPIVAAPTEPGHATRLGGV